MELRTSIYENGFTLCLQHFFDEGTMRNDFIEQKVFFEGPEFGKIASHQTIAGAYLIDYCVVNSNKPFTIELLTDEDAYQMLFFVNDDGSMMHQHLHSVPQGEYYFHIADTTTFYMLVITLPKATYVAMERSLNTKWVPSEYQPQEDLAQLLKQSFVMTPDMQNIVRHIIQCDRVGHYRRMYLEAKVAELWLHQIEFLSTKPKKISAIASIDVERMHEARDIIVKNIATPCSLIDLAKMVGTNEFKLKKHFKEIFGTTVFGYWNDLKMNDAKQKLLHEELNISEIAESLGYKNSNHFSTAFRKYFGHTPSEVKKIKSQG